LWRWLWLPMTPRRSLSGSRAEPTGGRPVHHDQQGSTRLLTGSTGKTEATFTYHAYGNTTGTTGTAKTPLGYDAQYTSSDTGLIYMRARVYDPKTAQFLSVDPLDELTWAPYNYANDNPANYTTSMVLLGNRQMKATHVQARCVSPFLVTARPSTLPKRSNRSGATSATESKPCGAQFSEKKVKAPLLLNLRNRGLNASRRRVVFPTPVSRTALESSIAGTAADKSATMVPTACRSRTMTLGTIMASETRTRTIGLTASGNQDDQ
jgi:RHS repeat-associated protein